MIRRFTQTVTELRELRDLLNQDAEVVILREAHAETEARVDEDRRAINFVLSAPGRKGDGIKLNPQGWDLESRFEKNPVMLDHHFGWRPPVGRWEDVRVDADDIMRGAALFAPASDANPRAELYYQLYRAKFMNAVSIGFKLLKWSLVDPEDRWGPIDAEQQLLYECSAVTLPLDPDAVQESARKDDLSDLRESAIRVLDVCRDDPRVRSFAESLYGAMNNARTVHAGLTLESLAERVRALEESDQTVNPAETPPADDIVRFIL